MPDLLTSLRNHDLGHLQIVADLWGLELHAAAPDPAAQELCAALPDPDLAREIVDSLSLEARAALETLAAHAGRQPWAEFERLYGKVREIGPGKRDRENPHLNPASPAEALYYRAFFARAFFDTPEGPREFAYIPDELLSVIRQGDTEALRYKDDDSARLRVSMAEIKTLGRPATPAERAHEIPADDRLLDDATTLLAALRLGIPTPSTSIPTPVIQGMLQAAGLLKKSAPQAEPVKAFLEAPRGEAMKMLADAWRASPTFNDLRQVPGLVFEGEWSNPSLATRHSLLELLAAIPGGKWWSLSALIQDIKSGHPDFQRPAGDYDSWFIKRASDGTYLRGFACWDEVDGALVHYLISGILHWLGLADLATAKDQNTAASFRLSSFVPTEEERGKISVGSNGKISIPRFAARAARYQISRFCEWDDEKPDDYHYHVTPASLKRAKDQGLKVEHLLPLLAKHSAGIPPAFVKALKRWETNGTEARIQDQVVLRVSRPEQLEAIRKSRAARFLGEVLSPTAVIVKEGAQAKVLAALAELGLLAEDETTKDTKGH
jgi:hypothetical protein